MAFSYASFTTWNLHLFIGLLSTVSNQGSTGSYQRLDLFLKVLRVLPKLKEKGRKREKNKKSPNVETEKEKKSRVYVHKISEN